jgi:hypothetical protein
VDKQPRDAVHAQKICSRLRTKNECDFCSYLCLFTMIGYDGNRPEIALGWQARARVEYMVPQCVALQPVAMSNARSSDGPVMQWDCPILLLSWHRNRPLLKSRRESKYSEVSSGVHQGMAYPALVQALKGSIDRHAFGDASKI